MGVLGDSRIFSGHRYIYSASCGHLCDSSAFLSDKAAMYFMLSYFVICNMWMLIILCMSEVAMSACQKL